MRTNELRQLTDKKLTEELNKARRSLAVTSFQVKTGKNQNFSELKKLRRLIARTLTLLKQRASTLNTKEE